MPAIKPDVPAFQVQQGVFQIAALLDEPAAELLARTQVIVQRLQAQLAAFLAIVGRRSITLEVRNLLDDPRRRNLANESEPAEFETQPGAADCLPDLELRSFGTT